MKSLFLFVFVSILALSVPLELDDLIQDEWQSFKVTHDKKYGNEVEEQFRKKMYLENRIRIAKHNKQAGEKTFKLGLNKYSDMLSHEFAAKMNGYRMTLRNVTLHEREAATFIVPENINLPQEVDWRTQGLVTPVKDQGQCGSCWAFSSTGALEGQNMRKSGELVSLSEQNLIDCSTDYGNNGCNGGLMDNAFRYVKANNGLDTEQSYPYEAKEGECRFNARNVGGQCKGLVDIRQGREDDLMAALATVGPISIAIDASQSSFQMYASGVYVDDNCSSTSLDHGVLLVGYGTEDGQDYWLVKNSWGRSWGLEGYIKMARNRNNQCGVATMASYPLV